MKITVDRKVIEQALEALEYMDVTAEHCVDNRIPDAAITTLRTALEEPEQEPVAHCTLEQLVFLQRMVPSTGTIALYTAPPQREWVGLTDEEYTELWGMKPDLLNFFRKIEAKLKEKNT